MLRTLDDDLIGKLVQFLYLFALDIDLPGCAKDICQARLVHLS